MLFALRSAVIGLALTLFSISTLAFTPTAEQIEQFKRMSPAQQEAIASSMGVNLDDINAMLEEGAGGSDSTQKNPGQVPVSGKRTADNPTGQAVSAADSSSAMMAAGAMGQGMTIPGMPGVPMSPEALMMFMDSKEDKGLQPYGYDLFDFGAETFTPAEDIPIPAEYILGPGDTINVQLYGKESSKHELVITRNGTIDFPRIGPVPFAGLTFKQVSDKIEELVREQMIGINASVSMGMLRTIRVFVLGDVNIPGSYVVGSLSTMTNAIFASGGITQIGSLRNIELKRNGLTISKLDLYDLLLNGDTSKDSRLLPGDVIFVPPVGTRAGIDGAVKRPAIYELKNEKTAADLVRLAGGLKAQAYLQGSKIKRQGKQGELTLSKVSLEGNKASKVKIENGDVLMVGSNLEELNDVIHVSGHVKRETSYAWQANLRFSDIITSADALLALPDLDIALIEREVPGTREIQILSFEPTQAWRSPHSEADPLLQARDKLYLFGFEQDRTLVLADLIYRLKLQANIEQREQTVIVNGSVRFPGEYPFSQNMSARQLSLLAGGFTKSALNREAEITRYELDEDYERIVLHIAANLESNDPVLEAGDVLRVQQIPLWHTKETVELVGEFRHPGTYAILPGETLTDVINRAGGLTHQAYAEGSIFSRLELRKLEEKRLAALREQVAADIATSSLEASKASADIDRDEANQILANIDGTEALGRLVIDLPGILDRPDVLDFQLADGDILEIPRFKPSITVLGEVQFATSHFYNPELDVNDYLSRSGGFKRSADKKRVYVIKANGSVVLPKGNGWFGGRSVALTPGDTIIVPLDTRRVDRISIWASVTQIMYQAAIGIAAIGGL